ncbi:hypothetical protein [Bacillus massiliigorillae]|uniref:hypothetical protein n=1 Tax=Bacillus massiliigorillae TaxID=1243664 RepID=UPI00039FBA1E|nr:hypothetical protein [Bacillus massiliigorillae]
MSKIKKLVIIVGTIFAVLLLAIGLLIFSFILDMRSDSKEEKKVITLAKEYIDKTFQDKVTIFDTLYDNMGNFNGFEYAAKVHHEKTGTEFLVYQNSETNEMEDTFIIDKWENDIAKAIKPSIEKAFGKSLTNKEVKPIIDSDDYDEIRDKMKDNIEINAYLEEEFVKALKLNPNHPNNYTDFELSPTIRITIPRHQEKKDEALINEVIQSAQAYNILKHGTFIIDYSDGGVPLEENELRRDF